MKTNFLNKIVIVIMLVIAMVLVSNFSYAASSITIAAGSTNLTVGSSTTLTIRGNNVIGKVNITSSNPGVVSLSSSQEWLEGSVTIRATAKAAGSAYITVTSADTSDATTGESVSVSTGVNLISKAVVVDTRSSNNYLSSLKVEGYELSPAFNANTNNYTMNVKSDVNEIKLSAIPADAKSKTYVNGNLDLVAGENNVTVTVTAENGYKRVYTIVVTKEKNPEDIDATISKLVVNNTTLKNEFKPDVFEYMCDDVYADTQKLDISLETKIPDLKYEITGNDELKQGINHIGIKVTSRDGSVTKEYEIIVFKSDEVLALQEVEEVVPEEQKNNAFIEKVKEYKYEIIFGSIVIVLVIILIVVIIVNKKRTKEDDEVEEKNNNNFFVDNVEDDTSDENNINNNTEVVNEDGYINYLVPEQNITEDVETEKYEFEKEEILENDLKIEENEEEPRLRKGNIKNNSKKTSKKDEVKVDEKIEEIELNVSIEENIEKTNTDDFVEEYVEEKTDPIVIDIENIKKSEYKKDTEEVSLKLDLSKLENDEE